MPYNIRETTKQRAAVFLPENKQEKCGSRSTEYTDRGRIRRNRRKGAAVDFSGIF
jgi:hypothetical protein